MKALGNGKTEWPKGPYSWVDQRVLNISIPFTWNLPTVRTRLLNHHFEWDRVIAGGPALKLMPKYFADLDFVTVGERWPGILQRVNPLATRSTEGCVRSCSFCGIGKGLIEPGGLVELADWPDLPIYCDNNILAASSAHFDRVIERCKGWGWADFNQGVDARLLTDYHAERFTEIGRPMIRLALDHTGMMDEWEDAFSILRRAGMPKSCIRSYALIGFNTGPAEAWERCRWIERHGVKSLPMWYHPLDALQENQVTAAQEQLGWTQDERRNLMMFFYQHLIRENRRQRRFYHPDQMLLA